ncbi:uroporphyrinogen decarboxylase family protein [Sporomusa aerivorans]|uniref:uroporphyrinogen decarboxylase family protein n=1 Tax=Sporomusa aerivorans TaxID=204936 RepID=UPI00352AD2B9
MKTAQELLKERTARVLKAIALEKPDRTPVVFSADAFCAMHMGVKLAEYCSSPERSHEIIMDSVKQLGDIDGISAVFTAANSFPLAFFANVKLPGRELPDNALWQIDEQERIMPDDYDVILNKGWPAFKADYFANRLHVSVPAIVAELNGIPQMINDVEDDGYMVYTPCFTITVNEHLGGGRSFPKFTRDLFRMPDKVQAVLDIIQQETVEELRTQLRVVKPQVTCLTPARGASQFFSRKLWERFVWRYLKGLADVIIEEGSAVNIHIDGNWERDLEYFKTLPRGKCVFDTDSVTDIYKIKKVLGDHMCIKGDVPAAVLTMGTPDEVYDYCTKLIRDMGPGFILSSGCYVPPNARVENVKAMISAASGK